MPQWKRLAQALPHLKTMRQLFDAKFYLTKYPDVAAVGVDPFRHYLEHGAAEGRKPHALFDPEYYLLVRRGDEKLHELPLIDFLRRSGERCSNPHPLFDCASYLRAHAEAAERGMNPLLHHVLSSNHPVEAPAVIPFDVAHFIIMDVPLTIVFANQQQAAQAGLDDNVALVWEDSAGRMQLVAPPEQRPFFEIMKYDQLRAQIAPQP